MINIKKPFVIKELLSESELNQLKSAVKNTLESGKYLLEDSIGRKSFQMNVCQKMEEVLFSLHDKAKEAFESYTLLPTYAFFAEYYNEKSCLPKHKDNAGNTYNINLSLYAEKPWSIFVEGDEFSFGVNEAVCLYGEDQMHWREPMGANNIVGNVFFFYAEPDHPFFTDPNFDKS